MRLAIWALITSESWLEMALSRASAQLIMRDIFSAIPSTSKSSALVLSSDVRLIEHVISELKPSILHLGASTDLLTPSTVRNLKKQCSYLTVMRSIPAVGDESIVVAKSYDGIADMFFRQP